MQGSGLFKISLTISLLWIFVNFTTGAKHEKILLTDVQSLTLYKNQYTTGRRSSPIDQLKCMGGSAAKTTYHPEVVQCYNRGTSDGVNVQWECKADLDNAVRFGKINVYCEGYDHPDDPYILKGSCGLEYYLEYTGSKQNAYKSDDSVHESGSTMITLFIVCAIVMFIYFACIKRNEPDDQQRRSSGHGFPGGPPPPPYGGPPPPYDGPTAPPPGDSAPPPYGFRPEHKQGASAGTSGYQEQEYRQRRQAPPGAAAGPGQQQGGAGFWTGLGTGGVLGYLFGRGTGNTGRNYFGAGNTWTQPRPSHHQRDDYGFFGSNTATASSRSEGSSGLGTRSASGYGETRRR